MHLGNGAITPECAVVALGLAAAGAATAVTAARASGIDRSRVLMTGVLAAAVFAAQMFNVQVLPYSSAHLIGGVMLAWMLGPALGLLTMTCVLALQAVLLGDGGLLELGANVVNMGLIPAALVAIVRKVRVASTAPRAAATLGLTAFVATVAAALAIVVEVGIGRSATQLEGFSAFTSQMLSMHLLAGVLEGIVTVAIVAALGGLASANNPWHSWNVKRAALVVAVGLTMVVLSLPAFGLASEAPDFYEAAAQSLKNIEA